MADETKICPKCKYRVPGYSDASVCPKCGTSYKVKKAKKKVKKTRKR
uniref:Uncharacterized protein n=1 Tax=viral metagenome TaxID=1070528 RepID=A0A6M3X5R8_9ZZZZ